MSGCLFLWAQFIILGLNIKSIRLSFYVKKKKGITLERKKLERLGSHVGLVWEFRNLSYAKFGWFSPWDIWVQGLCKEAWDIWLKDSTRHNKSPSGFMMPKREILTRVPSSAIQTILILRWGKGCETKELNSEPPRAALSSSRSFSTEETQFPWVLPQSLGELCLESKE